MIFLADGGSFFVHLSARHGGRRADLRCCGRSHISIELSSPTMDYDQLLTSSAHGAFNSMHASGEDYHTLLSSQRDNLFDRLSSELTQLQQQGRFLGHNSAEFENTPIYEPEPNLEEVLHSRRFSLSLGTSDHFPSVGFDTKDYSKQAIGTLVREAFSKSPKKRGPSEAFDEGDNRTKQKRRLSNLFLTPSFFEDHSKDEHRNSASRRHSMASRRHSFASAASFASVETATNPSKKEDDDDSAMSEIQNAPVVQTINVPPPLIVAPPTVQFSMPHHYAGWHTALDASEVKELMEAFTDAMAESQRSQQAIHDWDRKMGLKRSHSKTMRLSMRSRKKLKIMVKKDLPSMTSPRKGN